MIALLAQPASLSAGFLAEQSCLLVVPCQVARRNMPIIMKPIGKALPENILLRSCNLISCEEGYYTTVLHNKSFDQIQKKSVSP